MKKNKMPTLVVCLLIVLIVILSICAFLVQKYMPTKDKMNANEYYGEMAEGDAAIILGTEIMEQRGKVWNSQGYLPLEIVNTYLNQRYYWDTEGNQVLYATPTEVTVEPALQEPGGSVYVKDGITYLSLEYIGRYTDIDAVVSEEPSRIAVQYKFDGMKIVRTTKKSAVRYLGGIKAKVLTNVSKGTELIAMEELENWMQVATFDGYIGYIQKKHISEVEEKTYEREFQPQEFQQLSMDTPINLVWHQVTNMEANAYLSDSIQSMTGVNVISPTWFSIIDDNGNISDLSSADYVWQAHERGIKVWGLVDNFNENKSTLNVLSSTSARRNLISQLINAAITVGMDGINIDFENLSEDTGIHFMQFLREISVECHKNNLILSVDNPVPEAHTTHYDRAEQGKVVDYVIIMGYDEHYEGSDAGSVASLPWVRQGIIDTLSEVPAERVINGIPFYTRIWKTQAGTLSSSAVSMDEAQNALTENGAEVYWNTEVSQYYGNWESEGITYQIWLEDVQSIAEKVKLIPEYNLAGVAAWKLGLENSNVWQAITDNLR